MTGSMHYAHAQAPFAALLAPSADIAIIGAGSGGAHR